MFGKNKKQSSKPQQTAADQNTNLQPESTAQNTNMQPESTADNANQVQFEKNIKTLWIYTTLFCLFALVLIVVSSIIQGKINSKAEYYQDQYENAQTSSQSTIKNIQDENAALKKDIETYKQTAQRLEAMAQTDTQLINEAAQLIENAQYLLEAQQYASSGKTEQARTEFKKIDSSKLPQDMLEIYETLQKRLD